MTSSHEERLMLDAAHEELARVMAHRAAMAPAIDRAGIPEPEIEHVMAVEIGLQQLDSYTANLKAAVDLFDESYRHFVAELDRIRPSEGSAFLPTQRYRSRMAIAGRDGAMSIHHFDVTARALRGNLGRCRSLGDRVDHQELKSALRDFDRALPAATRMRDAVAHAAVRLQSATAIRRHAPSSNVVVGDGFMGCRFTMTWEGEMLVYDVAPSTAAVLERTRDRIWTLFR